MVNQNESTCPMVSFSKNAVNHSKNMYLNELMNHYIVLYH